MARRIKQSPATGAMLNTFANIIASFFIARDCDSVDLWGKKLNLPDCKRAKTYVHIELYAESPEYSTRSSLISKRR